MAQKVTGAKRGAKPKIDRRPDRDAIVARLAEPGANFSAIARDIDVDLKTLMSFRDRVIPAPIQAILARLGDRAVETAQLDVLASVDRAIRRAETMLESCDAWLRDPADPSRYNLNPRTHEVEIVFDQEVPAGDGVRTVRKTEKLSKLMADIEAGLGISVVKGESKTADPRKLLLDAVATLKPILELLGKAKGQIRPDPPAVAILTSPDWLELQAEILAALRPYPEAMRAVLAALGATERPALASGGGK